GERRLFDLIVRRFLAIWFSAARYQQTQVITEVASELFRTKGKVMLSAGWKRVYGSEEDEERSAKDSEQADAENTALPPLQSGEAVQTNRVLVEEKTTKPPKRFTQGDLLKAMETAGKQIDDEILRQQLKGKGLGTVATRPAILENLLQRGYIVQEQKVLRPTEKGSELIRLIRERLPHSRLLISAEMTGQMEFDLAGVEKGELALEKFMLSVAEAIDRMIEELRSFEQAHGKSPLALAPSGSARKAGGSAKKAFTRTAKHEHRTSILRVDSHDGLASQVEEKKTSIAPRGPEGFSQSNLESRTSNLDLGVCPSCGGMVIEGKKGYGCANWRSGCRFVVWKSPICGKVLTPSQMKSLLKKGKTPLIKGFKSKRGKSFAAFLTWEDQANGTLKFEFAQDITS
ncbi:MAG: DNA topoisomerase, partial [Desulfitobacteriaceae bacterium]